MNEDYLPRQVTSVLVEELENSVVVTWGLGEPLHRAVEYFGYEVYYYAPDGSGGKRFGVRCGAAVTARVWDNASATHANYQADAVHHLGSLLVATYRDAQTWDCERSARLALSAMSTGSTIRPIYRSRCFDRRDSSTVALAV
jgi:hypothetical protein